MLTCPRAGPSEADGNVGPLHSLLGRLPTFGRLQIKLRPGHPGGSSRETADLASQDGSLLRDISSRSPSGDTSLHRTSSNGRATWPGSTEARPVQAGGLRTHKNRLSGSAGPPSSAYDPSSQGVGSRQEAAKAGTHEGATVLREVLRDDLRGQMSAGEADLTQPPAGSVLGSSWRARFCTRAHVQHVRIGVDDVWRDQMNTVLQVAGLSDDPLRM